MRNQTINTETTTDEYMLLFRGPQWDKGLSPQELQQVMDKVIAWFEGLNEQGKIKAGQPLAAQGRVVSAAKGRVIADGPFAESKEAVGGYLVLVANDLNEAIEIAKQCPGLEYGAVVEVRPVADVCSIKQRAEELSAGQLAEATA